MGHVACTSNPIAEHLAEFSAILVAREQQSDPRGMGDETRAAAILHGIASSAMLDIFQHLGCLTRVLGAMHRTSYSELQVMG